MINYAEGIFTREFIDGEKKWYATFHPEVMVETKAYAVTKRWLIVLLHPEFGLQTFFLRHNELMKRWETDQNDNNQQVEDEMLQWCGQQIESGNRRSSL